MLIWLSLIVFGYPSLSGAGGFFGGLRETDEGVMFGDRDGIERREFAFLRFRGMAHGMPAVKTRGFAEKFVAVADEAEADNIRSDSGSGDQINGVISNTQAIFLTRGIQLFPKDGSPCRLLLCN